MVVAGYCAGLSGTAAVEDLESSDVEVGESLEPWVVEGGQAPRTNCNMLCNLDHKHIDPVVLSMSEIAQTGRWLGKNHRGVEHHSYSNAGADPLLNAAVYENRALQMKKIEDLLVGVPYVRDMIHTDCDSQIVAAQPFEGLAWGPGQAVGEPAVNLLKLDFERLGAASLETVVRGLDLGPGMESCSDYLEADSGVA